MIIMNPDVIPLVRHVEYSACKFAVHPYVRFPELFFIGSVLDEIMKDRPYHLVAETLVIVFYFFGAEVHGIEIFLSEPTLHFRNLFIRKSPVIYPRPPYPAFFVIGIKRTQPGSHTPHAWIKKKFSVLLPHGRRQSVGYDYEFFHENLLPLFVL